MKKTVMLAAALAVLCATVPAVHAESIPTPLRQVQSGVPASEVECAGERVLVVSPSGMPACVFESSVMVLLDRGFVLVDRPLHVALAREFDIRAVTDPARIPAPFGLAHIGAFWADYDIRPEYTVISDGLFLYREIDLDHELASGRMNAYLGITNEWLWLLFDDVKAPHMFNVTIPYAMLPPITPITAQDTFASGGLFSDVYATVHNQTSTAQTVSFEVSNGPGDAMIGRISVPVSGHLDYIRSTDQFYRHWQHDGNCDGSLIPVPRQDGTDLCIQPTMLEFILISHDSRVDESTYQHIIREHEKLACPPDAPVFLATYYDGESMCTSTDGVTGLFEDIWWFGGYTQTGFQYDLS